MLGVVKEYATCYKTIGTCYLACYMPFGNIGSYGCKI